MNKEYITKKKFDDLRTYDEVRDKVLYIISDNPDGLILYGWSDDGKGIYFYRWYRDFKNAHEGVGV